MPVFQIRLYKRSELRTGTRPEKEKGGKEMNLEKLAAADIGDHDLSLAELRQLLQQASRAESIDLAYSYRLGFLRGEGVKK